MNWQTVESSQIAELGYDEESQKLGCRFRPFKGDGPLTEYAYSNVPFRVYRALLAAKDDPKSSIGKYFDVNIKKHPDLYPYEKIGTVSTNGSEGEVVESPGSALAKIDKMTADQIFVSNALDPLLIKIREEALVEAKKYDISTPDKRKGLKSLAFKLVKTRTFIEGLAKAHTIETKRKLALIDSEKRRVCDIIQGIEDEVRSPLTEWENKEKARVQKHEDAVLAIREMKPHLYLDVPSLVEAIKKLEAINPDDFEEYRAPAIAAKEETLETLQSELDARKKRQAETEELERLRAEAAQRAEQDRIAEQQRQENERIAAAVEAAKQATREEVIAELTLPPSSTGVQDVYRVSGGGEPTHIGTFQDGESVVDTVPLPVSVSTALSDGGHQSKILAEVTQLFLEYVGVQDLEVSDVARLVEAIAKGLIPHVTIQY